MSFERHYSLVAERSNRGFHQGIHQAKTASTKAESTMTESTRTELDPLLFYESPSVGKEFTPFIPSGNERRINEARRDKLIVENWRGVPTDRGEQSSLGDGFSAMRSFEAQRIIDSERMFLIVLATMTVLLGAIFTYFVMNFGF